METRLNDLFVEPNDATRLQPEEREGLKQTWVTSRSDLNIAEQDNIDGAARWAHRTRRTDLVSVAFAVELHRRMFNNVWSWAGKFRLTERNIGIEPHRIAQETAQLIDDAKYWVENAVYGTDELAVRLHHRLVYVHPFPNGNGRHARLMADLLARRLGPDPFSWGGDSLRDMNTLRRNYIAALQAADQHDYAKLITFARS